MNRNSGMRSSRRRTATIITAAAAAATIISGTVAAGHAAASTPDNAVWVQGGGDADGYRFGLITAAVPSSSNELFCKSGRAGFITTFNGYAAGSPKLYVGPCFKVSDGKTDSDFFSDGKATIDYTRSDGSKITMASLSDGWHFGVFEKRS